MQPAWGLSQLQLQMVAYELFTITTTNPALDRSLNRFSRPLTGALFLAKDNGLNFVRRPTC